MDTHYRVLEDGESVVGADFPFNVKSETVKGSNIGASLHRCVIRGGVEDCVDFVRGGPYLVQGCTLIAGAGTRCFVTAKGGIDGLTVKDTMLVGDVKWSDIRLGDHTIYNDGRLMGMKNVVLDNVWRVDKKPVKVLVLDCERPVCLNGDYKVVVVPKVLVWLFMKFKKWTGK